MSAVNKARLLSYIERVERLEEEKKAIADDIKDVKAEAKSAGFDVKMITKMIALRRLTPAERRLEKELTEIYEAACGLLDGTPLGDAARERLMKEEPNAEPAPEPPAHAEEVMRTVEEAREEGGEAFRSGVRIIDNPYTAGDPRRAAWDEGFCAASGSDGMDIPEAWRRKTKKGGKGEAGKSDRRDDDGGASAEAPAASDVDPDQEGLPFDEPEEPAADGDGAEDGGDAGGEGDAEWPFPEPDEPWKNPYAPPAPQPEGDAAERLDDLVKRTRRKQVETAATKEAAKEAAKRAAKGATKRGAKAPAKPRKGDGEGRP